MTLKRKLSLLLCLISAPFIYVGFEPFFTALFNWQTFTPSNTVSTPSVSNSQWQTEITRSQQIIDKSLPALATPSLSLAVGKNGEVVWAQSWGYANIATQQPADAHTRYRLGSTSKWITALLIGQLLEKQQITLDTPLQQYLPAHSFVHGTMTLRHVLSHSAGIRDYGLCFCAPVWETLNRRHFDSVTDSLRTISGDALLSAPGEQFRYSSLGFNIAGAVIEQRTQQHFLTVLKQQLTEPYHVSSIGGHADPEHDAEFYETREKVIRATSEVDLSIKWPSGGLLATPTDLVKLGNAFVKQKLFSADTFAELTRVQQLNDGKSNPQNYALGMRHDREWYLHNKQIKVNAIHHGGTAQGSTSWFVIFPDQQLVISILINRHTTRFSELIELGDQLAEQFIPLTVPET